LASFTTTEPESPRWPKKYGSVVATAVFAFGVMIIAFV